jgi:hypothetical protein
MTFYGFTREIIGAFFERLKTLANALKTHYKIIDNLWK